MWACINGVGVVMQASDMRLKVQWVLSSPILIGCTALMRANSPKHPPGCLQFAKLGKGKVRRAIYIIMEEGVE